MPFIDAVVIKGQGKSFTVSVEARNENLVFVPFDLSPYSIRFKIMGAPTADAAVLVEHLITGTSDLTKDGLITNAQNGEFTFTITKEDTLKLGLGKKPIMIDIVDEGNPDNFQFSLTEGGSNGEFNKIFIVQV